MESVFERRKKINSILGFYADFLKELSETLWEGGNAPGYPDVRARAFRVLDETLTGTELDAVLMIEGELKGRFPGVERRIKELLRNEITGSLISRGG